MVSPLVRALSRMPLAMASARACSFSSVMAWLFSAREKRWKMLSAS